MFKIQGLIVVVVISIFIQESYSLKCYVNVDPTDPNSKPSGQGSEKTCTVASSCIKMTQDYQTVRMCDDAQLCSFLRVSNNDCKTSSTCNFSIAAKTNSLQSLINPANRDSTDCIVCCCDKDGCNFAIGTKAYATFIRVRAWSITSSGSGLGPSRLRPVIRAGLYGPARWAQIRNPNIDFLPPKSQKVISISFYSLISSTAKSDTFSVVQL